MCVCVAADEDLDMGSFSPGLVLVYDEILSPECVRAEDECCLEPFGASMAFPPTYIIRVPSLAYLMLYGRPGPILYSCTTRMSPHSQGRVLIGVSISWLRSSILMLHTKPIG